MGKAFESFDGRTWNRYFNAINAGKRPEECGIDLSEEEKAAYIKAQQELEEERKKYPNRPLGYGPVEVD